MASSSTFQLGKRILPGFVLLLIASVSAAAPAFVSGAGVEKQGDSASITILLACQVNYLSHTPSNRATVFRIQLDATSACNGVSPTVINTQEYYRPARAADAKLTSIEYDGTAFGNQVLTLSFSDYVSLSIEPSVANHKLKFDIAFKRPVERRKPTRQATSHRVRQADPASQKTLSALARPQEKVVFNKTKPKVRAAVSEEKLASLMRDGRSAMIEGRLSTATQIYTKILQYPEHEHMPEAQEYLALAREKNGQTAHAKAEYQRYLTLYPDADGVERVKQRLAALLARSRSRKSPALVDGGIVDRRSAGRIGQDSPWRVNTFVSQYYRRDVNQIDENDKVVSQSSLFSDINFDARRRGTRYDFSSRLSAGYRYDLLGDTSGSGNDVRISYAYADLADAKSGLRGRVGRQSRNTGGVLGRFDGLNLGYQLTERTLLNAVAGKPVNSAADGIDDTRTFYGLSANFGPIADNLDLGVFYVRQDADGFSDREAIGAEVRYFDSKRSLWGLVDYDVSYKELGSVFLQGVWRFESQFALNALIDRRRSPFLSTSNALIGQPFEDLTLLSGVFSEQELRQLSLDRSAITTTYTVGASHPLSPYLQLSGNITQSTVSATPASGGVAATPETVYRYYSMNLVASSLLREGDVSIIGLRYSQSASTDVTSINLDARYPFTRAFYINPRLRVDYRQIHSDSSTEWILTPGLRIQYRLGRTMRIELHAGRQFAFRDMAESSMNRDSYFINLGYQAFFQ